MTGETMTALTMTIEVASLGDGVEATAVNLDVHAGVPAGWVILMLRRVADGLENGEGEMS